MIVYAGVLGRSSIPTAVRPRPAASSYRGHQGTRGFPQSVVQIFRLRHAGTGSDGRSGTVPGTPMPVMLIINAYRLT